VLSQREVLRSSRLIAILISIQLASLPCFGALFKRGQTGTRNSRTTLRKRLHVNSLITPPGETEIDWGGQYSLSTNSFSTPSAVKYTPEGGHILWGRTEYSAAFDSLSSSHVEGGRVTQFSQALTFAATSVVYDTKKLDIAIAPQATFFLHDESGARLGAVAIARYDSGRNSIGGTVSWSGATHTSPSNPAGIFDAGFGFGRQLAGSRLLEHFTPHINVECEKSTGHATALFASEGIEYQVTERLAFDLSAQHFAAAGSAPDHQIGLGMTLNLGRLH